MLGSEDAEVEEEHEQEDEDEDGVAYDGAYLSITRECLVVVCATERAQDLGILLGDHFSPFDDFLAGLHHTFGDRYLCEQALAQLCGGEAVVEEVRLHVQSEGLVGRPRSIEAADGVGLGDASLDDGDGTAAVVVEPFAVLEGEDEGVGGGVGQEREAGGEGLAKDGAALLLELGLGLEDGEVEVGRECGVWPGLTHLPTIAEGPAVAGEEVHREGCQEAEGECFEYVTVSVHKSDFISRKSKASVGRFFA